LNRRKQLDVFHQCPRQEEVFHVPRLNGSAAGSSERMIDRRLDDRGWYVGNQVAAVGMAEDRMVEPRNVVFDERAV
jgi:hypothetical protein